MDDFSSSVILSASMAILPRTAYSIAFRLSEMVSIDSRLRRGGKVFVEDDVVADVSDGCDDRHSSTRE